METAKSVIIVGAGLAGLTAAIHLSKIGYQIIIIDNQDFPKHKVCGEYISNEVIPYFDWLELDIATLKPTEIDQVIFSTVKGKVLKAKLPLGGFGLSRYSLDYYLYRKAVRQKCIVIQELVTNIDYFNDIFSVTLANNEVVKAEIVLGAFGKRSQLDQKLDRNFFKKKSPWLAVKGHYKGNFPNNVVGLHNFKGGYCGVSKVENDIINICYLADYETFKSYKNIEEYEKKVVCENPNLQTIFENATPLFEKPITIGQISFNKKEPVEKHILMIGDTAGLIHPLCGNGMAIAIHSAKIASELVDDYFNDRINSRNALEKKYTKLWNHNFKNRLKIGRLLAKVLRNQKLSEILMRILILMPFLLPQIIKNTHGKTLAKPKNDHQYKIQNERA